MAEQTELLEKYYRQNARKLREKVDKILSGFGGITEKDYDELTKSDRMFVRKVVSGQSDRLVEMLDASFLKQKI